MSSLDDQLNGLLRHVRARTDVPGLAVAVSSAGHRVRASVGERWAGTGAPMAADGVFDLGCIGSLLTAMITLGLARDGALSADAAVSEYLGELAGTPHGECVRVRHLLSHTAGYGALHERPSQAGAGEWRDLLASLRTETPLFTPGGVFSYEPVDSLLLDLILRRVTGRAPTELVREMIFEPLGIGHAAPGGAGEAGSCAGRHGWNRSLGRLEPTEPPRRSADLWSSSFLDASLCVDDLVTVGEALLGARDTLGDAAGALAPAVAEAIQRRAVRLPPVVGGVAADLMPVAFGLGAAELPGGFWGHNGVSSGQCCGLGLDRRRRICVAVGVNAAAPHVRNLVMAGLLQALSGVSIRREAVPLGFEPAEAAGTYVSGGARAASVSVESGALVCRIGTRGRAPSVRARLALDVNGTASLLDAPPHLALGFFREPGSGDLGLLVGMSAFKRAPATSA